MKTATVGTFLTESAEEFALWSAREKASFYLDGSYYKPSEIKNQIVFNTETLVSVLNTGKPWNPDKTSRNTTQLQVVYFQGKRTDKSVRDWHYATEHEDNLNEVYMRELGYAIDSRSIRKKVDPAIVKLWSS